MVILLDLSAVFDIADHDLLLSIHNKRFGISDTTLAWYESYLHPRQMQVCVNITYSKKLNLKYGVPQGSCWGANNFTAYCSPIGDLIPSDVDLSGYADDHSHRKSSKASSSYQEAETVLSLKDTVKGIGMWMEEMRLKLNPEKTEFILFGSQKKNRQVYNPELDDNLLEVSSYIKYLGGGLD